MAFLSAEDDFRKNTLAALPNALKRLDYLAQLRENAGDFSHWGLERVHGKKQAQQAMRDAFERLLAEILRIPVQQLWKDAQELGAEDAALLRHLGRRLQRLVTKEELRNLSRTQQLHLRSVLAALQELSRSRSADSY
jgi:hypothetical protein